MNVVEALRQNGYEADISRIDGVDRVQLRGAYFELWHNPALGEYQGQPNSHMRDATVQVAILEFSVNEASPLAAKFSEALVKLLTPANKVFRKQVRPLVRITPTTVQAVYRTDSEWVGMINEDHPARPTLFQHGFDFPDGGSFQVATLHAICSPVPLDGAQWLNGATPLTVKRDVLPVWNAGETAKKLRALVDKFVAAGEIRECSGCGATLVQDYGHEAALRRVGVEVVPAVDDTPEPIVYADPRLAAAFGVSMGVPAGCRPMGDKG